jgi:murein DD-endopeptidase MepM/ murein hydrolase activator NlpD
VTIGPITPLPLGHHPDPQARDARVPEVARDLEALLVTQLIAAMRKTVPTSGMLQASASRRTLDGAFDHELARALVAGGSLGIARQIESQIAPTPGNPVTPAPGTVLPPAVPLAVPATTSGRGSGRASAGGSAPVVRADARVERSGTNGQHAAGTVPAAGRAGVASAHAPVEGARLTSGYGTRRDPFSGAERFHGGVDLAAPRGTPIRVAADGEVVFSGWRGSAGQVVEVRHADGLTTSYAHADQTLVASGQKVVAGDVIGTVGSTGRSTGPHLHFSARVDGQLIDPARVLPDLG